MWCLFTNTPIEHALQFMKDHYHLIAITVPKHDLSDLMLFIFDSYTSIFNNTNHKQIYGHPICSPLNPIIADCALLQL